MTMHRCFPKEGSGSPPHPSARHGFTLIELLTVIGIIAILAAILIPVAGNMRSQAKGVECVSRLRQATAALLMHAAENGNSINYKAGGSGGATKLWAVYVANYLAPGWKNGPVYKPLDVLFCPSYAPFKHDPDNSNWQWDCYGGYFVTTSYVKKTTMDDKDGTWSALQVNLANLPSPGAYPILMDSITPDLKRQRMNIITHSGASGTPSVHMRHNGLANAAFYDGHVKALNGTALKEIGFVRGFDKDLKSVNY